MMNTAVFVACVFGTVALVVTDVSAGTPMERHVHTSAYTYGPEHWSRIVVEVRSSASLAGALGETFVTST
jgi:hypothetical protein